ncbi:hypothetical protein [Bartonella heixiaziensis]|uniref:hypothetical protein n=1 Tax=Bartonella heixiaziensis TaxID=1461000 RepID=UPI003D23B11E
MRTLIRSAQIKRTAKCVKKRGKDMKKLRTLLLLLFEGTPLPKNIMITHRKMVGKAFRDAHIHLIGCGSIVLLVQNCT